MGSLVRWTPSSLGAVARDSALAGESESTELALGPPSLMFLVSGWYQGIIKMLMNLQVVWDQICCTFFKARCSRQGQIYGAELRVIKSSECVQKRRGKKSHNYRKKRTQQLNLGIKKLVCVWVGWGEQTRRRYEIFAKGIKTILVLKRSIGFTIHRLIFFFCVLP